VPFLNQDPKALNVVQYILESCLLRREKSMRDKDGRLIVDLPPKTVRRYNIVSCDKLTPGRHTGSRLLPTRAADLQVPRGPSQETLHPAGRGGQSDVQLYVHLGHAYEVGHSVSAGNESDRRLRQCVDHPLLVLGKGANEAAETDDLLGKESKDEKSSIKEMIAAYAGGARHANGDGDGDEPMDGAGDSVYAQQVLKELGESEQESECFICTGEIFDEVLLPCYHRG